MTRDMWHMTLDTWHMTHDRWGEVNILSKCQLPSSYVWEWRCSEDISTKDHSLGYLMNDEGVSRTAPATPGLLNILFAVGQV